MLMRKEVLFAVFAGIVFGLVVALGIWRANSALTDDITQAEAPEEVAPTPSTGLGLTIHKPENGDVITNSPTQLTGITQPNIWVAISAQEEDYTLMSDASGEFSQETDLIGGVNQILVTAFAGDGTSVEETVTIVFSTEFEATKEEE